MVLRRRVGSALRAPPYRHCFRWPDDVLAVVLLGCRLVVALLRVPFRLVSFVMLLSSTFSSCFGERWLLLPCFSLPSFRPSSGFYGPRGRGGGQFRVLNFEFRIIIGHMSFVSGGFRTLSTFLCQNYFHMFRGCGARLIHCLVGSLCFAASGPYIFIRVRLWCRRCPSLHLPPA